MTKVFAEAVKKIAELSEDTQNEIGYQLMDHYAAIQELREELAVGIRQLDAGLGKELDIEDVISRAQKRHGKKR